MFDVNQGINLCLILDTYVSPPPKKIMQQSYDQT